MTAKNPMINRIVSLFLCLAILVTYLPISAIVSKASTRSSGSLSDPSTMHAWKEFFLPENGDLSTEYAGEVWTDKSVFSQVGEFSKYNITMGPDSLLVALSAIASNMQVTGESSVPTDTILVLDVSNSMATAQVDEALVDATNASIAKLLEKENNRVGVVLYSGSSSANGSAAVVLLPLDHYKTTHREGKYLSYNQGEISVNRYVTIEGGTKNGQRPSTTSKSVSGATYIQTGIALAMQQFTANTNVINAQENRKPVMVLMSDGNPTLASSDFTNPGKFNMGMGNSSSAAMGFVTQLTASYARNQIAAKYKTEPLFYTIGIGSGVGDIATNVLNPSVTKTGQDTVSTTMRRFWNNYTALSTGESLKVQDAGYGWNGDWFYWDNEYVDYIAGLSLDYVDRYFDYSKSTENLNQSLIAAFEAVVAEIELQSVYNPTHVQEDEDLSGYVSFVDRIGQYMEVVDVKGIIIGDDHIFSGVDLSSNFVPGGKNLGTSTAPTALGTELVHAVMHRLGLPDADTARTLIGLAYEYGQLSYTSETEYSNYIGWCADTNGDFLGFWHEGLETLPTGTVYIMKSYGYLGEVNAHAKSDMMYAIVQVRESVDTGEQMVSFGIPAALLPTITYNVTLNDLGTITDLSVSDTSPSAPMRLLYEVSLKEQINEFTVLDEVSSTYRNTAGNTNADGSINFYSNQYELENVAFGTVNTYSYFRPSRENTRYYYQEDIPIYMDTQGTLYESATHPREYNGALYHAYTVYKKIGNTLTQDKVYHTLTEEAVNVATTIESTNNYAVPSGTVRQDYAPYYADKSENKTQTVSFSAHPFTDIYGHNVNDTSHRFVVGSILGNNGLVRVTPAAGIKISKTLSTSATATAEAFQFTLTNLTNSTDNNTYPTYKVLTTGAVVEDTVTFANGVASVSLRAGEVLYVGGMTANDQILVEEVETVDYMVESVNGVADAKQATVTIVPQTMQNVAFVNTNRGTGNLTITKQVDHDFGEDYQIPADRLFTITVTLQGIGTANATFQAKQTNSTITSITTNTQGTFTVTLRDGERLELFNLPAGTQATVVEHSPGSGFTAQYWDNGLLGDGVVQVVTNNTVSVIVLNDYEPARVYPVEVDVAGTKTLTGREWKEGDSFTFELQKWIPLNETTGTWEVLGTNTVDYNDAVKSFSFENAFSKEAYTSAGSYYYRVVEVEPTVKLGGVTYDKSIHSFVVDVADLNMDGQLEIQQVRTSRPGTTIVTQPTAGHWHVETNFTNTYTTSGMATVTIDVNKLVTNPSLSPQASLQTFTFGLFEEGATVATYTSQETTDRHFTRMVLNYDVPGTYFYWLREIQPTSIPTGWTYSTVSIPVTVEILDTGNGTLEGFIYQGTSAPANPGSAITANFTNIYQPTKANLSIDFVEKSLSGRDMVAEEFTFEVQDLNGNTVLTGHNEAAKDGTKAAVKFSDRLSFDKVGTYHYNIVETSTSKEGVTVDSTTYRITVTVVDVNGSLNATYELVNVEGDAVLFQNSYQVTPVTETLSGAKELTGRTLLNEEFVFLLTEALDENGNVLTGAKSYEARNQIDGSFAFPTLTYRAAGTYYYTVVELTNGSAAFGIKFDETKYIVTVVVEDVEKKGSLTVTSVSYKKMNGTTATGLIYKNEYQAAPTSTVIPGNKNLTGKSLVGGDFLFELYASDSTWATGTLQETVSNALDGSFTFQSIPYDTAGSYYYLVKEKFGGQTINGITYDDTVFRVLVEVKDDLKGQLYTEITIDSQSGLPQEAILFENLYSVSGTNTVTVKGTKTLNGRTLAAEEFTFQLYQTGEDFVVTGTALASTSNAADGSFQFQLDYDASDVGNTYYYVVKELHAGHLINGVTYSEQEYHITVIVEDKGDGTIKTTVIIQNGAVTTASMDFVNEYSSQATEVDLSGKKVLDGIRKLKDQEFLFEIFPANDNYDITGVALQSVRNDANGDFQFLDIPLTEEKTYYFVIKENTQQTLGGVKYDNALYYVEVGVSSDGLGQLHASTPTFRKKVGDTVSSAQEIQFTNTYTTTLASVSFDGDKYLEGIRALEAGEFTFELYFANEDFQPTTSISKVQNDANGWIVFPTVPLDEAKTYYLLIRENRENPLGGVGYDETEYHITVVVKDNEKGALIVASQHMVKVEDGITTDAEYIDFVNSYTAAPTKVTFEGKKTLDYRELSAGDFTFDLYPASDDFVINGSAIQSVQNLADGSFQFVDVPLNNVGTYYFVAKENSQNPIGGILYDNTEYHITVVVEDDKAGHLEITSKDIQKVQQETSETATKLDFKNTYSPQSASLTLEGIKDLSGRDLVAGEFTFVLEYLNADGTINTNQNALQAVNQANGSFVFDALSFTLPGTYFFRIKEDTSAVLERVKYDTTNYYVTVTVTDPGTGILEATYQMSTEWLGTDTVDTVEFKNVYTPKPEDITVEVVVNKTVVNLGSEQIGPENFQFRLEQVGTENKQIQSTNAEGKAVFQLTFTEEDLNQQYTYSLGEISDGRAYVTYSTVSYEIEIAITLSEENKLVATIVQNDVTVPQAIAAFENSYNPPPKTNVETGDKSQFALWLTLLFVSGSILTLQTVYGKLRKSEEAE